MLSTDSAVTIGGRQRSAVVSAKQMASELLRRGHRVTDVARAARLHRVTVQELKRELGLTSPAEKLAHTQAQLDVQTEIAERLAKQVETVEEENGQLAFALVMACSELAQAQAAQRTVIARPRRSSARSAELEQRLAATQAELAEAQAELKRTYTRERRKDQELRDLRKDSRWQRLAIEIASAVGDVLPESVWWRLLEGEVVKAQFDHRNLDRLDRRAELVLADDTRQALRDVINLKQTLDLDDGDLSQAPRARRDRFARAWRTEMYGEE